MQATREELQTAAFQGDCRKKENENACWEDSIASAEASPSNSTPERVKDAQEVANKQVEKTSNSVEE